MLNSLIIEGTISKIMNRGDGSVVFSLIVENRLGEISHFEVRTFGKLAENHILRKGTELRICGCLRETHNSVFIIAEALDIKKIFNPLLDEI